ncbi:GNAT family N-acetyltransferase [Streptomyces roseirectus]|uniref:GNAT family N-acetyltransferase n=1 Tax=Streptomyces roseirectus TaxID=2768066 RepID=A0A7H0IJZ2_9ACTN|nr:GNAT family N-acetyltransferase [Streptomyces roseirectus]QNP73108.1 GNAT family N-acetyltransferase [Streptomyces roseirectus]
MPTLRIRPATPADAPSLARLDHHTWSRLHAVMPRPAPDAPFFDDRHHPDDHLIATLDGVLVGYLRLVPAPLAVSAHVRQIQGLAVADEARGAGVGRALIRAALTKARGDGARRVTLRVLGHNTPARKLYEAEGFVVEGVLPGEFLLDGEYVDDVVMGRAV